MGACVVAAYSGEEAIALPLSRLPAHPSGSSNAGIDGFQVLRKLRSLRVPTPVVALTAHGMESEVSRTRRSGFDGHLVKPLQRSALVRAVKQIIDRRSSPVHGWVLLSPFRFKKTRDLT